MTHKQAGGCSNTHYCSPPRSLFSLSHFPFLCNGREGQRHLETMVFSNQDARPGLKKSGEKRALRSQGLPSPALCCACGLCIMLAGINITLVGALAFTKLLPLNNPPIIIGPILLLVAFSFFGACCICSRRPIGQTSRISAGRERWPLMRMGGAVFEMETSEPTLQDTTAIQLSPTNSPSSSHRCSPTHLPGTSPLPSETSKGTDLSLQNPTVGDSYS
ncbi:Transmembrane protein 275 [Labeo rohita]|uniref:Transmembrane protein 275 n=2 Tax=Labeo rohita TaxID=84645 RepID=A0ABQ8M9L9_LABRO|nr:Transmembrane protein 275 [Labeo rohita]